MTAAACILSAIVLALLSFASGVVANDEANDYRGHRRNFVVWCGLAAFLATLAVAQVLIAAGVLR